MRDRWFSTIQQGLTCLCRSVHDRCHCCERAGRASASPRSFPASARTENRCRLSELIHSSPRMAHLGLCHYLEETSDIHVSESFPSELRENPEDPSTFRTSFAACHKENTSLSSSMSFRLLSEMIFTCGWNSSGLRIAWSCAVLQFAPLNWKDH